MNAVERSVRRQTQYSLFFQLQSEGLEDRSIGEYREEMWALSQYAMDPALRSAAAKAMTRYDEGASGARPFPEPVAANSR